MQRNFGAMRKQVEAWQRSEPTDVTAKLVICEAFVEGKLEVPKHPAFSSLPPCCRSWRRALTRRRLLGLLPPAFFVARRGLVHSAPPGQRLTGARRIRTSIFVETNVVFGLCMTQNLSNIGQGCAICPFSGASRCHRAEEFFGLGPCTCVIGMSTPARGC
jgi:hypothetical protein